jgi:hypothetical protein
LFTRTARRFLAHRLLNTSKTHHIENPDERKWGMDRYLIYVKPHCKGLLLQNILYEIERYTNCHFSVTFDGSSHPCLTCSREISSEKLAWIRSLTHVLAVKKIVDMPTA